MTKQETLDKLNHLVSKEPSTWIKDAERRQRCRFFIRIWNRIHLKWLRLKRKSRNKY